MDAPSPSLVRAEKGRAHSAPASDTPVLDVRDLTVTFPVEGAGSREVVSALSYSLNAGRTLGVVGESGCGKTMSALAVLGLVPEPGVVTGSIRIGGKEMVARPTSHWRKLRGDRVAMVFQEPMTALNPVLTIGYQIGEVLVRHRKLSRRAAFGEAIGLLQAVGIPSARKRATDYPHQLSGGMRQRAMIAMALACKPALLVADEPTTALDVTIQAQILDLMLKLQEDFGMAIQFISHNLAVVSELADHILVMYAGRAVEYAPASTLFANPRHPYTRGLLETLPNPDRRVSRLPVIAGNVPRAGAAKSACGFADRCPRVSAECRAIVPPLEMVSEDHLVACLKAQQ
jgi:oligopeptide/dipeptide ABC transporter ATP-binding protein